FLMNYIPTIGSIIAAIPTMLLGLVQFGWSGMIWTGVGYLAVNMIMGTFVEPRVMGKDLGLSTFVVFLSLIVWGYIFGYVGMFLSIPLTMTIKIILEVNPKTEWIAIMLGTEEEARKNLKQIKNKD
ncbi:AI-2E family transporter, partial [Bacteroidota bacterium]